MNQDQNLEKNIFKELDALRRQLTDLERHCKEQTRIFEDANRIGQIHAVLNRLLYIAIENITLESMLQKFIYEITSLPWLALQSKGAIFFNQEKNAQPVIQVTKRLFLFSLF